MGNVSIFILAPPPYNLYSIKDLVSSGPDGAVDVESEDHKRAVRDFWERWRKTPKNDDLFRSNVVKFEPIDPQESESDE